MFSFPSGEPQGKDGNQKIRDTCKQYLDRVEELQQYLEYKEVAKSQIHIFVYTNIVGVDISIDITHTK